VLVERVDTAEAFLAVTAPLRAAEPFMTNVLATTALSVATGLRSYDAYFWWVVTNGGEPVAMAMRTAPHGLFLGPMNAAAASVLGAAVAAADPATPSLTGPTDRVRDVLAAMGGLGRTGQWGRRDVLYAVDHLVAPTVPGAARVATDADLPTVQAWRKLFDAEVNVGVPASSVAVAASVRVGSMRLWELDGDAVSLAGHAPVSEVEGTVVARVGPVFTPMAERGRGYAAGVTAAVTQALMDKGARVMLYADADNPTSQGVYRRLGYTARAEIAHYEFSSDPAALEG
jgi:predicted GNAT family acetyltransferase